jgi:hypothetical protein
MIGTRKLGDIKKKLQEIFRKDKKCVQQWVDEKRARRQNSSVLEELTWVEKLLREAIKGRSARSKRSRKRTKKEASA